MATVFTVIILTALLFEFTLDTVADLLNLRSLKLELPPALEGVYKQEEYRKSQEYTRSLAHFGFVTSAFNLLLILSMWFTGGFNYLDLAVRSWGFGATINGLLYIAILGIAYSLLMLPFDVYSTFIIEESFGFNKTTKGTFIVDRLKALTKEPRKGCHWSRNTDEYLRHRRYHQFSCPSLPAKQETGSYVTA